MRLLSLFAVVLLAACGASSEVSPDGGSGTPSPKVPNVDARFGAVAAPLEPSAATGVSATFSEDAVYVAHGTGRPGEIAVLRVAPDGTSRVLPTPPIQGTMFAVFPRAHGAGVLLASGSDATKTAFALYDGSGWTALRSPRAMAFGMARGCIAASATEILCDDVLFNGTDWYAMIGHAGVAWWADERALLLGASANGATGVLTAMQYDTTHLLKVGRTVQYGDAFSPPFSLLPLTPNGSPELAQVLIRLYDQNGQKSPHARVISLANGTFTGGEQVDADALVGWPGVERAFAVTVPADATGREVGQMVAVTKGRSEGVFLQPFRVGIDCKEDGTCAYAPEASIPVLGVSQSSLALVTVHSAGGARGIAVRFVPLPFTGNPFADGKPGLPDGGNPNDQLTAFLTLDVSTPDGDVPVQVDVESSSGSPFNVVSPPPSLKVAVKPYGTYRIRAHAEGFNPAETIEIEAEQAGSTISFGSVVLNEGTRIGEAGDAGYYPNPARDGLLVHVEDHWKYLRTSNDGAGISVSDLGEQKGWVTAQFVPDGTLATVGRADGSAFVVDGTDGHVLGDAAFNLAVDQPALFAQRAPVFVRPPTAIWSWGPTGFTNQGALPALPNALLADGSMALVGLGSSYYGVRLADGTRTTIGPAPTGARDVMFGGGGDWVLVSRTRPPANYCGANFPCTLDVIDRGTTTSLVDAAIEFRPSATARAFVWTNLDGNTLHLYRRGLDDQAATVVLDLATFSLSAAWGDQVVVADKAGGYALVDVATGQVARRWPTATDATIDTNGLLTLRNACDANGCGTLLLNLRTGWEKKLAAGMNFASGEKGYFLSGSDIRVYSADGTGRGVGKGSPQVASIFAPCLLYSAEDGPIRRNGQRSGAGIYCVR